MKKISHEMLKWHIIWIFITRVLEVRKCCRVYIPVQISSQLETKKLTSQENGDVFISYRQYFSLTPSSSNNQTLMYVQLLVTFQNSPVAVDIAHGVPRKSRPRIIPSPWAQPVTYS